MSKSANHLNIAKEAGVVSTQKCARFESLLGVLFSLFLLLAEDAAAAPGPVTAIQSAFTDQGTSSNLVSATFSGPNTAGDCIVISVGWANAPGVAISSVTDSQGNTYNLGIGPTSTVNRAMYYALNIGGHAAGNVVKVTFTSAGGAAHLRIAEFSGVSSGGGVLDGGAGRQSTSATPDSGAITTTANGDLLVCAFWGNGTVPTPGAGFTQLVTDSWDAGMEYKVAGSAGSYDGTWNQSSIVQSEVQMIALTAATPTPTPIPGSTPTVAITAPAAGATLTGTVTVTASASEVAEVGMTIAAVQLQVDGVPLGTAANASPYTFSVNTANFANGTHSLTATAWDSANVAGNSSPVSVNFSNSNPGNPAQFGVMSGVVPLPLVSVHQALLPGGKVLMVDGEWAGTDATVWNPVTNIFDEVPVPVNIFCNGMDQMADGRLLVAGGHGGSHIGMPYGNIFDPSAVTWTVLPDMAYPRWYPTVTMLPDKRLIVTSGETTCNGCDATIQEIYDPSTNSWSQLSNAPFSFPYYPRVYLLSDGRILVAATMKGPIVSHVLDLNALIWTAVGGPAVDGLSSAMYLPDKILKEGLSADPGTPGSPSVATAYVLDMTQTSPTWREVASMTFPRCFQNTTLLPDGTVLVTGGGLDSNATDVANAVYPVELWSPATETWTTLASMNAPRLYHSEALLLPDGRVVISGGGRFHDYPDPNDQLNAEFFAPPYLFKGSRPVITSAPAQLSYGQNFTVQTPNAAQIAAVSLIRYGSVTHAFNMGQHFLPLSFSTGNGSLTISAPVNANLAPPGNYLLFIVNTNGVPSVAVTVHF
jgi:Domain of unknown function (DUF1929)/Bacterial Ig domain/Galactose oxidase, central domain